MRIQLGLFLTCLACGVLSAADSDAVRILQASPLRFEPAAEAGSGHYVARGLYHRFSFAGNEAILNTGTEAIRMRFEGASRTAHLEGAQKLRATSSVFQGNDRSKWRGDIPNYGRLEASELYRGIDLAYYGNAGKLEYDLIVKPGADPRQVRLRFDGVRAAIDREGNLVAGIVQRPPVAYQMKENGEKVTIASRYRKHRDGTFGFALGAYDHSRELVIDPAVSMAMYLGGSGQDTIAGVGHDAQGFLYVAGSTYSTDVPLAGNSAYTANTGNSDLFLVKIDPRAASGSQVVYATYYGGTNNDVVNAMTVSPRGYVYLTGTTASTDFPLTNSAQGTPGGALDSFVVMLDPSQSGVAILVYATYFGGAADDVAWGIATDTAGMIYITGSTRSDNMPASTGFQTFKVGYQDAFVAAFDPNKQDAGTLFFCSYLGGSSTDVGRGIAAAPDGTVWFVGGTFSYDFSINGYNFQYDYHRGGDAFVTQINPRLGASALMYSTFLGGSGNDEAEKVVVDASGKVIVTGVTLSNDFPVTPDAIQSGPSGNGDLFLTVFYPTNPVGTRESQVVYSTYLGGRGGEAPTDIKVDATGNIYVTGYTFSPDFPVTADAIEGKASGYNAFATKVNPARPGLSGLSYSTYITSSGTQSGAGIDFDSNGTIYVAGSTSGRIFDALGGPAKATAGDSDGFLIGLNVCNASISPLSGNYSNAGGTDTITVSTGRDCGWTASGLDWVSVDPSSGVGNGSVRITIAPNTTGQARTGTITVAGIAYAVNQQ